MNRPGHSTGPAGQKSSFSSSGDTGGKVEPGLHRGAKAGEFDHLTAAF
ncbi:hypothetical protein [Streptomyces sp. CBMA123]|nr:hypothetical protein [Streptomyces sp. CBMA123]